MNTIRVTIVSAEEEIWSGDGTMVVAPASHGEVGIMPRHAPFLTLLSPGEVKVNISETEEVYFFVSGGVMEVQPDSVTVLADTAIRAHNLDEAMAQEAKQRAEDALHDRTGEIEYAQALAELSQSIAQLRVIQRIKSRKS